MAHAGSSAPVAAMTGVVGGSWGSVMVAATAIATTGIGVASGLPAHAGASVVQAVNLKATAMRRAALRGRHMTHANASALAVANIWAVHDRG